MYLGHKKKRHCKSDASYYSVVYYRPRVVVGAVTVTFAVRFVPVTVKDCAPDAVPVVVSMAGTAFVEVDTEGTAAGSIVNVCAAVTDVPVATVIGTVPADVISVAAITAVSCVGET